MGKNKGKTNNEIKREKCIRQLVIAVSLVALFWAWMLYTTRPATEGNTYQYHGKIDEVVVDEDRGGARLSRTTSYDLIIYVDDECYLLDTQVNYNKAPAEALAQRFLAVRGEVTLTVLKRPLVVGEIFDYMLYHQKEQMYTLEVVAATGDGETLWSLEAYNEHQRQARRGGYIAGTIITLLVGGWELMNWKIFYPRRNKKKQKRSEAS